MPETDQEIMEENGPFTDEGEDMVVDEEEIDEDNMADEAEDEDFVHDDDLVDEDEPEPKPKKSRRKKATAKTSDRANLPKNADDIRAIRHIPTTEATRSFGAFIRRHLVNADNFEGISDEQAWTVIGCHRAWQQSDERKAERAALDMEKDREKQRRIEELKIRQEAAKRKKIEAEMKRKEREARKREQEEENGVDFNLIEDLSEDSGEDYTEDNSDAEPVYEDGEPAGSDDDGSGPIVVKRPRQRRPRS